MRIRTSALIVILLALPVLFAGCTSTPQQSTSGTPDPSTTIVIKEPCGTGGATNSSSTNVTTNSTANGTTNSTPRCSGSTTNSTNASV